MEPMPSIETKPIIRIFKGEIVDSKILPHEIHQKRKIRVNLELTLITGEF